MGDLDAQREDAMFNAVDARERYPVQCANELSICNEILNEVSTEAVVAKPTPPLEIPQMTDCQKGFLKKFEAKHKNSGETAEIDDGKLCKMLDKIDNLKVVLQQLENDKICEINKLI